MKYLIETYGCQMNVHDSERMAGLLEQAGYEPTRRRRGRRRHRHQHVQRARARRGEALHAARRDPAAGTRERHPSGRRGRRLRRAAGRQTDPRALVRRRRRHRHPEHQAAADARGASGGERRRRATDRRYRSARRRVVSSGRRAAHRSGEGLRHHHRGLQRVLRLLRRALHARPRAHASCRRRSSPRPGRRSRRARSRFSSSDRSSITTRRPTTRRATSRRCSRGSTRSTDWSAFASPARIPRHVTPRMIAAMRDLPKVCRHLHLPVQSGSTRVLGAMRRRHTRERVPRARRPASARHAGHRALDRYDRRVPGRDGRRLRRDAVADARRSATTACSRSSIRRGPNTLALKRMPDDVTEEEKTRRIVALQTLQKEIQGELYRQAIGREELVLVESRSRRRDWELSGRTSGNTVVNFAGDPAWIGRIVPVRITAANPNSLRGRSGAARRRWRHARLSRIQNGGRHADRNDDQGTDGRSDHQHADHHPARQGWPARAADLGRGVRGQRHCAADGERHHAAADDARPAEERDLGPARPTSRRSSSRT